MKSKTGFPRTMNFLLVLLLSVSFTSFYACDKEDDDNDNNNNQTPTYTYKIVDTDQTIYYDNTKEMSAPVEGADFYGQDANYMGNQPSYTDNGDGTISDNVTGLMWTREIDAKVTFAQAKSDASTITVGGHTDWRLPTIKELYSLIIFSGLDISGPSPSQFVPFINDNYFEFEYGDEYVGERLIDAQYWSATEYVSTTMNNDPTVFGVNFADGRIKGYPKVMPGAGTDKTEFVRYVRGNTSYGLNDFKDNGDGTISDLATGLMWMQDDNGEGLNWKDALAYAEGAVIAGHDDWRLPNAKELQSILDYTKSPATSNSPAIDALFSCSNITVEEGKSDYPFYWTGTTHANSEGGGDYAAYVCFGTAYGFMESPPASGSYNLWDVHGAGAQRSDPKMGDPANFPYGHGPQGDVVRIVNYVRLVRDIE